MKFIGHLGKFEDLAQFDTSYEFPSKMNSGQQDSAIDPQNFADPNQAFGLDTDEDDTPF